MTYDINFKEYYASAFQVNDILSHPTIKEGTIFNWLVNRKGSLV